MSKSIFCGMCSKKIVDGNINDHDHNCPIWQEEDSALPLTKEGEQLYSKEDMRKCFEAGQRYGQSAIFGLGVKWEINCTDYLNSLNQKQ